MTFGTGTLQTGTTSEGVSELQQWLIDRHFLIARSTPTGIFDDDTFHAVKAFQFSAGIDVDGVVGNGTRTAADQFSQNALTTGWHPTAVRNVQVDRDGGSFTTDTRRGLLHTTEGTRLPAYDGTQPHFTIGRNGSGSPVQVWQHLPITRAARALRNDAGGAQTNRYGVIQVEIIGSAAESATMATRDPELFQTVGHWMRWVEATAGVANVANHPFDGESAYGLMGTTRLAQPEWEATTGWVGHQHVPENTHWDPGQIDIAGLLGVTVPGATSNSIQRAVPAGPSVARYMSAPGDPTATPPRIRATTRRLTNAFPSLTFTIETAGSPFFEVVVTTDRSLFDDAQASRRTCANYYRSGPDGLRQANGSTARFVAPVGALQDLAEANPHGARIFYTVVGYADDRGSDPTLAAPWSSLALTAPSVEMMPGFRGHTTTETLGVPLSLLKPAARQLARSTSVGNRVRGGWAGHRSNGTTTSGGRAFEGPTATIPGSDRTDTGTAPVSPTADRLEGEDGYDVARHIESVDDPIPTGSGPASVPPAAPAVPVMEPQIAVDPVVAASYDDGFGDLTVDTGGRATAGWAGARAQSSEFPAGHQQPRALYDSESPAVQPDDEYDDLGWAGTSYSTAPEPAATDSHPAPSPWRTIARPLPPERKRDVIEAFVGDDTTLYSAISPDGEFNGSSGTDHPAFQRYHTGLSFGIAGFSQDSGALGQLLVLMRQRDESLLLRTFGPDADRLVDTLTRPGPLSKDVDGGRSVRVQPVVGADVWDEPWRGRFVEAGAQRAFRGAQIELAAGMYLDPVVQFATDLGLATERGLAMIFDRAAHRGVVGGMNWVIETVGPIQTPVLLRDALNALGFADTESFQRSQPDLLVDDQFGPLTHAAVTAAVRASGSQSPPIFGYQQMIDSMAERATGQPWGDRIVRLARAELSDAPLEAELVQ